MASIHYRTSLLFLVVIGDEKACISLYCTTEESIFTNCDSTLVNPDPNCADKKWWRNIPNYFQQLKLQCFADSVLLVEVVQSRQFYLGRINIYATIRKALKDKR